MVVAIFVFLWCLLCVVVVVGICLERIGCDL
jgi:hypothetical protein